MTVQNMKKYDISGFLKNTIISSFVVKQRMRFALVVYLFIYTLWHVSELEYRDGYM